VSPEEKVMGSFESALTLADGNVIKETRKRTANTKTRIFLFLIITP
jgi:hypothetical protein